MQTKTSAFRLLAPLAFALCIASASAPAAAQSTVLTFNDLALVSPATVGASMPDGYGGFDWGGRDSRSSGRNHLDRAQDVRSPRA